MQSKALDTRLALKWQQHVRTRKQYIQGMYMHASARAKALVATLGGHSLTPGKIMSPERHSEMNLKQHPLSTQPSPGPKETGLQSTSTVVRRPRASSQHMLIDDRALPVERQARSFTQ